MLKKLISIMLAALLLLSVSGCEKSAGNDNVAVVKPPSTTTAENIEAPESLQPDDGEITSDEEPVTEKTDYKPDESSDVSAEGETDDPYAGYGKDNYQEDPAEFIFGVQHIIQDSHSIEEMYQALAEFDAEGRIDKVLLSFDGVPAADGDIRQGMYCEVYYDNETSWFNFSI